jgi:stage V sporulation protein B
MKFLRKNKNENLGGGEASPPLESGIKTKSADYVRNAADIGSSGNSQSYGKLEGADYVRNEAETEGSDNSQSTDNMKSESLADIKISGDIESSVCAKSEDKNVSGGKNKNKKPRFKNKMLRGAVLLASASVIAKFIGVLYRIPLTNIIGAEGMGIYQLIFPVYALFMVLATAGIPTALSRVVAERRARGEDTKKYLAFAMLVLEGLAVLAVALIAGLSKQLAAWQGNEGNAFGFLIIAPSILFVGAIAGFRGYFQGELDMLPTALSNIIEQIVKLAVGISLAVVLAPRGVKASVGGAIFGITVSEAASMLYLLITYLVKNRKREKQMLRLHKTEASVFFKIAAPIALVAVLLPLSGFFDSLIIVNMLKLSGYGVSEATAAYGLLSGPVNSFVNMPIVVIMSIAVVIVPAVSASRVQRDIGGILTKSRLSIKLTYLLGIPCALFFMVFSGEIVQIFYPALTGAQADVAANLLMVCAFNIVLMSAMQVYVSLLQALDKSKLAVLCVGAAVAIKVVLTLVLVRFFGIMGAAAASVIMNAVALAGVNIAFFRLTSLKLEKNIGLNLLAGVIMAIAVYGVKLVSDNIYVLVSAGLVAACAVYFWLVFLMGVLSREEIGNLPLSGLWLRLHRVIRFWEYKGKNET